MLVPVRREYKMFPRINMDKWEDTDFLFRFRITKPTTAKILALIDSDLKFTNERSRYIWPITQLLILLRFCALGSMEIAIADFGGVSASSICRILPRVANAICKHSKGSVRMPGTEQEMAEASTAFYKIAKFPRTIGAIDCTHIRIQSLGGEHAEVYRNQKGWFLFNVQTVASANLKVLDIVTRWPGSTHDQTIFNNSVLKRKFEAGQFREYILVGDSGYRNTMYLATPFLECTDAVETLYNESQIRTRTPVERSYGVRKRRFPVLSLGMRVKMETVRYLIMTCCILHNIAIDERDLLPPIDENSLQQMVDVEYLPSTAINNRNERTIRKWLIDNYFPTLMNVAHN